MTANLQDFSKVGTEGELLAQPAGFVRVRVSRVLRGLLLDGERKLDADGAIILYAINYQRFCTMENGVSRDDNMYPAHCWRDPPRAGRSYHGVGATLLYEVEGTGRGHVVHQSALLEGEPLGVHRPLKDRRAKAKHNDSAR